MEAFRFMAQAESNYYFSNVFHVTCKQTQHDLQSVSDRFQTACTSDRNQRLDKRC